MTATSLCTPCQPVNPSPKHTQPVPTQLVLQSKDRLTVQLVVNHEHRGEQPDAANGGFWRMLDTVEQPWMRRTSIGEEWTPLDFGWIKDVGYILLLNRAGADFQVNPSEEERQELAKKLILIRSKDAERALFRVHPGSSLFVELEEQDALLIRSASGETPIVLHAYPR